MWTSSNLTVPLRGTEPNQAPAGHIRRYLVVLRGFENRILDVFTGESGRRCRPLPRLYEGQLSEPRIRRLKPQREVMRLEGESSIV